MGTESHCSFGRETIAILLGNTKNGGWGTWMVQSVKCLTLDFGSGHDLTIVGLSPALGSALSMEPAWNSLSLSLSLSLPLLDLRAVSQNKHLKKKKDYCIFK